MRAVTLFAELSLVASAIASPVRQWTVGQEVQTSSGTVKGQPAERSGYSEVSQYVGIPYAKDPVGALRWMPPKAFKSTKAIDGTKWVWTCYGALDPCPLIAYGKRKHDALYNVNCIRLTKGKRLFSASRSWRPNDGKP